VPVHPALLCRTQMIYCMPVLCNLVQPPGMALGQSTSFPWYCDAARTSSSKYAVSLSVSTPTVRQPFQNHSQCADAMCKVIHNRKVVADNEKHAISRICRIAHGNDKWRE